MLPKVLGFEKTEMCEKVSDVERLESPKDKKREFSKILVIVNTAK